MHRETKDILLSIGLMIFFLLTYFFLIPLGIFVPSSIKIPVMSPDFFPKTVSVLVIVLSLILLIQSIILARTHTQTQASDDHCDDNECKADRLIDRRVKIAKIGGAVMLLFLYYGTVIVFGILPASIVFLLAFSLLYGERRFKITIPLAVMLPVLLYLFFTMVTNIPLPKGILFE